MKRIILAAAVLLIGATTASARDSFSFSINYNLDPFCTTRVREVAPIVAPVYYPAPRPDWRPVTVAVRGDDDCRTVVRKIYRNGVLVGEKARTVCTEPYEGRYRDHDRWDGWRRRGHDRDYD